MARQSPLGAVARGLVAGAIGTGALTAYQSLVARLRGQDQSPAPTRWQDAPAPAQVGKRILTGVFDEQVGVEQAGKLAQVMHWSYGTCWGAVYGLVEATFEAPSAVTGPGFGTAVWGMSYAQLVPMGIYEPPWKYPAKELAIDFSYHVVYGLATALAFGALRPGRGRARPA